MYMIGRIGRILQMKLIAVAMKQLRSTHVRILMSVKERKIFHERVIPIKAAVSIDP